MVSGTDSGVGMGSVTRNVDGGGQASTGGSSATFTVSGDSASHSVVYFATDAAGNASASATQTLKIDTTAPTAPGGITASSGSSSGQINVTGTSAGTDALSGVAGYLVYYVLATTCPAAPYGASQYARTDRPRVRTEVLHVPAHRRQRRQRERRQQHRGADEGEIARPLNWCG